MRTAVIAIAITLLAVLAAVLYHLRTVDSWADRLRAEQRAHEQARAELTACKSASRAACAVQAAKDGKADAGEPDKGASPMNPYAKVVKRPVDPPKQPHCVACHLTLNYLKVHREDYECSRIECPQRRSITAQESRK